VNIRWLPGFWNYRLEAAHNPNFVIIPERQGAPDNQDKTMNAPDLSKTERMTMTWEMVCAGRDDRDIQWETLVAINSISFVRAVFAAYGQNPEAASIPWKEARAAVMQPGFTNPFAKVACDCTAPGAPDLQELTDKIDALSAHLGLTSNK